MPTAARRRTHARPRAIAAFLTPPLAVALALAGAAQVAAAPLTPLWPTLTLNETPPCSQDRPDAARLASGDTVVTWIDGFAIEAQILGWPGGAGLPQSGELELDPGEPESNLFPFGAAVAADPEGGFVVAWWGLTGFGPDRTSFIFLRLFDGGGSPRGPIVEAGAAGGPPVVEAALALDREGRPAVVWTDYRTVWLRLFEADLTPRGGLKAVAGPTPAAPPEGSPAGFESPALAIADDGELRVVWGARPADAESTFRPFDSVRVRRFAPSGSALGPAFTVNDLPASSFSLAPAVATLDGGGTVVAWTTEAADGVEPGIYGRLLDDDDVAAGPAYRLDATAVDQAADPDLAALPGGGFLAAWGAYAYSYEPRFFGTLVRVFAPGGQPIGDDIAAGPELDFLQGQPALAVGDDGRVMLAWRDYLTPPPITLPPCSIQPSIRARPFLLGCIPNGERLCLQGGRFAVEVEVDDPRLGAPFPRRATGSPLTDDTGAFWFFRPENPELMLKVLDGRGVNDFFWFFSGALSNVGYEIVVTDTRTGTERRYENLPGELASRADTRAFADPPPLPGAGATGPEAIGTEAGLAIAERSEPGVPSAAVATIGGDDGPEPLAGATHPLLPCSNPHLLCVHDGRFGARVDWHDPRTGDVGTAFAEPLGDRGGTFWFFRHDNREMVFKIVDGRPVNGWFWIFFGALTDLEYTITVEDRLNHTAWRYDNPPFTLTSHADTRALADPPLCPVCSGGATTRSAEGNGMP